MRLRRTPAGWTVEAGPGRHWDLQRGRGCLSCRCFGEFGIKTKPDTNTPVFLVIGESGFGTVERARAVPHETASPAASVAPQSGMGQGLQKAFPRLIRAGWDKSSRIPATIELIAAGFVCHPAEPPPGAPSGRACESRPCASIRGRRPETECQWSGVSCVRIGVSRVAGWGRWDGVGDPVYPRGGGGCDAGTVTMVVFSGSGAVGAGDANVLGESLNHLTCRRHP